MRIKVMFDCRCTATIPSTRLTSELWCAIHRRPVRVERAAVPPAPSAPRQTAEPTATVVPLW